MKTYLCMDKKIVGRLNGIHEAQDGTISASNPSVSILMKNGGERLNSATTLVMGEQCTAGVVLSVLIRLT